MEQREWEKNEHFNMKKKKKKLDQNYEIPQFFPDFLGIQNFPDHFPKFPDFSQTWKKIEISLTFP